MSSALTRRFNTVVLPTPATLDDEVKIVQGRASSLGRALEIPAELNGLDEIRRVVTVFRELRGGVTLDGEKKLKSPTSTLSTAEAISVVINGLSLAAYFGRGQLQPDDVAAGIVGAVIKDPSQDRTVWLEYLETVARERQGWARFYEVCRAVSE
jgi:hypothetical protein